MRGDVQRGGDAADSDLFSITFVGEGVKTLIKVNG